MGMSPEDLAMCRSVIKTLTSEKYKGKNYLFLQPFDLSQTPGYMDVVTKLMDLSTLSKNLEAGEYSTRSAFFKDCFTIFENAIAYHASRDSKWIAKLAKDMLKIAQKQQQKLLTGGKISSSGGGGGDGSSKKSVGILPTKKNKKLLSEGGTKLKLKIGGQSAPKPAPSTTDAPAAAPSKPKVSIKLKGPSQGKVPPPGAKTPPVTSSSSGMEEKKSKKPRLTLKIGKSKDPTPDPTPSEKSTSSSTPKSTSSTAKSASASAKASSGSSKQLPTSTKSTSSTKSSSGAGKLSSASVKSTSSTKSTPASTKSASGTGKSTPSSSKSSSAAATEKSPAKVVGAGGSRGKELPEGVSPPKPEPKKSSKKSSTKKTTIKSKAKLPAASSSEEKSKSTTKSKSAKTKSKSKITLKPSPTSAFQSSQTNYDSVTMTPARKAQASKVLSGLKRRQYKNIGWFTQPVADKAIIQDYRAKITHPMDLNTMQTKLEKNEYPNIAAFVLDLRRIFGNCLKYNTSIKDGLRPVAVDVLTTAEQVISIFLAKPEHPTPVYPPLLFCWKLCLSVLDTLNNLSNPSDGQPTAYYFLHPVSFYCGGQFPPDYLEKVAKPMDFGTVTSRLIEGHYSRVDEFQADCKLVIENCMAYYGGLDDGKVFVEQANRLKDVLQQQLDALNRYIKSSAGESVRKQAQMAVSVFSFPKPPIPLLLGIVEELRALKYTDKATKITEPAMAAFEKPVSTTTFPDYTSIVKTPMDLQTVVTKIKSGSYANPEDFEHDMLTIFQNCIAYNGARKTDHLVAMGKYGMKHFRKIFANKMKAFDDPSSIAASPNDATPKDSYRKAPPDNAASQGPAKKLKMDSGVSRGKTAARSTPAPNTMTEKSTQVQRSKSPKPTTSVPKSKPNQPVPLHIAIAQVKEQFPLRRAVKTLQSWEAGCARFFKELMRHSWISAARPKFIFHVPVPVLFPELREAYAMKVKKPMDLTTVECALLAGNRYATPEDFISDVALVFSNAIKFNKDGRDIGDPLSCAYYDASIHLLRYSRWLSLELLSEYVEDSEHVDEAEQDSIPVSPWKLTEGNRKKAREEMEAIVLKEPIEKSLEGDRYTWMEAECEKLLKALRHQSDLRHMTFFIQPNYPPDYAAFISKPMDWEKCQRTLKKRQYDKFGDIIDDLRLIFSNALKYNARHAGTDTVSGQAFNAAKYMSGKLEVAINKMMLTVSDRLERERIDHNNAEREIEAAERAEEELIRAKWKNENSNGIDSSGPARVEAAQRVRSTKRTVLKENTDFEVPFFDDEDDGQHERSYFEVVRQQKAMFERQRQELSKMQQSACSLGSSTFLRCMQRELALKWVADEKKKLGVKESPSKSSNNKAKRENDENSGAPPSSVLSKLEKSGRKPMQLKLSKPKPKNKVNSRKRPLLDFGDDDDNDE